MNIVSGSSGWLVTILPALGGTGSTAPEAVSFLQEFLANPRASSPVGWKLAVGSTRTKKG